MSAYTTVTVSRQWALNTLMGQLMTASNETLGEMLFDAIGEETLNNFTVEGKIEGYEG